MSQAWLILAFALAVPVVAAAQVPDLRFEASPALRPVQQRLESWNLDTLRPIGTLVGLFDAGPPIRVVLAEGDSPWARLAPEWASGFAVGRESLIVLFPSRSPSWPHDTLEDVLRHEVTHILIDRAAGGRRVPRWFHEGLSEAVERPSSLADSARLASVMWSSARLTPSEVDALFDGSAETSRRGYVLAAALVRDLITTYGPSWPAAVLREVAAGQSFDAALRLVTGRPADVIAADFWDRQRRWTLWIPLVASSTVVWLGIIALAALARRRRRARAAAIRQRWDAEERSEVEP